MGLRLKFNLVLLAILAAGLAASAYVSWTLLQRNAREEVLRNGGLMMEAALAIRGYTVKQVKPHIDPLLAETFIPQAVPAYAAVETLSELRKMHPDYAYREATLNPTNLRDRASDWEADIVRAFRDSADRKEIIGERDTPTGRMLYIARPIRIKDPACLACHSVPPAAPASMLKVYGEANGFGWKLDEVIGSQIVTVPMQHPIANARQTFFSFMTALGITFASTMLVLNLLLEWLIIRPITRMSQAADEVSTGNFAVPEFAATGRDEVAVLGASFNRMRRSLAKAMELIG